MGVANREVEAISHHDNRRCCSRTSHLPLQRTRRRAFRGIHGTVWHRTGVPQRTFVLVTFPEETEEDGLPLAPPTAATPDSKALDALDALVAREVPFFSPLERSP